MLQNRCKNHPGPQGGPKGAPKGAQGAPKAAQGVQKGPPWDPQGLHFGPFWLHFGLLGHIFDTSERNFGVLCFGFGVSGSGHLAGVLMVRAGGIPEGIRIT